MKILDAILSIYRHLNPRRQRRNRIVTYQGRELPLIELCRELGLSYNTVSTRLYRLSWPLEKAIETPVRVTKKRPSEII